MNIRSLPLFAGSLLLFAMGVVQPVSAQAPPFSYRGVYDTTLPSGAKKVVFYVL